ncbi:DNA helicase MCM8-like [Ornithodoros turicata]|uniref:DNA helicase MCM8-like n=1 Tax=Ornithodoros turicata TaxID=34597 RepID=UPI00313A1B49
MNRRGRGLRYRGRPPYRRRGGPVPGTSREPSLPPSDSPPHQLLCGNNASPYAGWSVYFPGQSYLKATASGLVDRLRLLEKFFHKNLDDFALPDTELAVARTSYQVDVDEIRQDDDIKEAWPTIIEDLRRQPRDVLSLLGLALYETLNSAMHQSPENDGLQIPKVDVRLAGLAQLTPLREIRTAICGELVAVRGTVVRASEVRPQYAMMGFDCLHCGTSQAVEQPAGYFTLPTKCPTRGCRSRSFKEKPSSALTKLTDWQSLRLQELEETREGGRLPRMVDCELLGDLVDSAVPGDVVTVVGTVDLLRQEGAFSSVEGPKTAFISANNVLGEKGPSAAMTAVGPELTTKDYYAVEAIHEEPHLFRFLVNSLCPPIYGHEVVKAGLLLALVGGVRRHAEDPDRVPVRGDPHVLLVGDPGLGKSQLLQACARLAPRGVYVCGNTSSTAGLTVAAGRGAGGEASLEAGALVLADRGCCCIDELDKMAGAQGALLEAMEQQSISVAKAELAVSLPARAGVIAAANPAGGHYQRGRTVAENLRMNNALLSRFDLVFILLDRSDKDLDRRLSEHIMALHSGGLNTSKTTNSHAGNRSDVSDGSSDVSDSRPLAERLRGPVDDPVPPELLRKYIAYARQYVHPSLSTECSSILRKFYLELRRTCQGDCIPVTTRQLESLIRLVQARARLELREVCTAQDAQDIVEIMKHSMADTLTNELGQVDFGRSQHGSGMSRASQARSFIAVLTEEARMRRKSLFSVAEMKEIATNKCGISSDRFPGVLDSLNNQGFLLSKGNKRFQLQTSEY